MWSVDSPSTMPRLKRLVLLRQSCLVANDNRLYIRDFLMQSVHLVLYYVATVSKEAAHVPVSASDLHSGQGIHLCQFKVLRVTTSQVRDVHVHNSRSPSSTQPRSQLKNSLGASLKLSQKKKILLTNLGFSPHYCFHCQNKLVKKW